MMKMRLKQQSPLQSTVRGYPIEINPIIYNPKSKIYPKGRHTLSLSKGFTIVELLVVIVVIGILAAITIVSYFGISQRADLATLQSDLKNASIQLETYKITNANESYPPDLVAANLKSSLGTNFDNYFLSIGTYCLQATNHSVTYHIRSTDKVLTSGKCPKIIEQIATGSYHSCVSTSDGNAYCAGRNDYGQVGDGSSGADKLTLTTVSKTGVLNGSSLTSVSAGNYFSCALASNGNAYCWGNDIYGQIGDGTSGISSKPNPTQIKMSGALSGLTVKSIASGTEFTCAIASDNNVYCWGRNDFGQIGDQTSGNIKSEPTAVYRSGALNNLTVKTLSVGAQFACVIASDNNAYCWGRGDNGQIGDGNGANRLQPTAVNKTGLLNGLTISSIGTGSDTSCVTASNNNSYCWGNGAYGEIGDGNTATRLNPTAVNMAESLSGLSVNAYSGGFGHICAIASDNNLYCWGRNATGEAQIGDGTSGTNRPKPTTVVRSGGLNGLTIKSIDAGLQTYYTCAIASNNNIYCWGLNYYGQFGNGSSGNVYSTPTSALSLPE